MTEVGPQAPDIPLLLSPLSQSTLQAEQQPGQLAPQPSQQGQQMVYLNWSYFKPEFSEKTGRGC